MKLRNLINNLRANLKHLALALALGSSFLAASAQAATLTWNLGGGGNWDESSPNWTGDATTFISDGSQDVIFSNAAGGIIAVADGMAPASTTVSAGNYTFSGGAIAGTGSLTKSGGGTLTLSSPNSTYTGKTSVQGGTLVTAGAAYLSNAGTPGVFGAPPAGPDATIDLHNGVTLQNNGSNPRVNQSTDRSLNLASTDSGTVSVKYNDNDASLTFGAVTATGTGPKTLALFTGINGNGDREAMIFTGPIDDSSDGSPTSLAITFNTQGSPNWVSLNGVNTFTGPITLAQINGTANGVLVVGGVRVAQSGNNTVGTGSLGNGNYPGAISLGARTVLEYDSTAGQTLSGVISGPGAMQVTGSGQVTLSGANTYSGNTTVNSGCSLVLDTAGGLNFVLTNGSSNKITGAGTATLDGTFTIDTTAVSVGIGSWPLVDVATKTFGSNFSVSDFNGPGPVWTKSDGIANWSFDATSGVLSASAPALITAFGIPGTAGVIDQSAKTITLAVPGNADLAALAPTYTLSSGSCPQPNDGTTPPTPSFASGPVTYTVTDGATVNDYVVTVTLTYGLNVRTFDSTQGTTYLNPIANLLAVTPSGTGLQAADINYGNFLTLPGITSGDTFSVLWEGWFDVTIDGTGDYTFGTASDDGSVVYMDLNRDGDFSDDGELIVNNNNVQGTTVVTGTVALNMDSVHMVIGYFEDGGGEAMAARFKKGSAIAWDAQQPINGTSGHFFSYDPHPPAAEILSFGIPGSVGAIDQSLKTIALIVPWTPWGTSLATLNPTFTLSSGTCVPASGAPPSPSFAAQNPATYTVTDGGTVNTYEVTVTVTPASTAKSLTKVYFPGLGYAHATDATATSYVLNVPSGTPVSALSPTYEMSPLASGAPVSGSARNFTTAQTYTITAEDGSQQDYSVAVAPYAGYAARVMASNPFAYWPMNEGVGFVAYDNASSHNGSYSNPGVTFGVAGPAGENAASFNGAAGVAMEIPQAAALSPDGPFSVEMWAMPAAVPPAPSPQYVASNCKISDPREGWYLAQDAGGTFGVGNAFVVRMFNRNGVNRACQLYAPIDTVRWYHLVLTWDGTTAKFYADGVSNETDQFGTATLASYFGNTTSPYTVGKRSDGALPWAGSAAQMAFYTRALTPQEVQFHFSGTATTLSYADWASTKYPSADLTNPAADLDGDAMSNFEEYAFGLDPTSGTSLNPITASLTTTGQFSYTRTENTGLAYTVWTSTDLQTWAQDAGASQTPGTAVNGVATVAVQLTAAPVAGKLFVRVQAQ